MKALILAGGYGTRLYPLTLNLAKPLLAVNDIPIIDYLVDKVKDQPDLTQILVVTNEKFAKDFENWARSQKDCPAPVTVINDGTTSPDDRLGSIGDIDFVIQKEKITEDILVMGGDNLFDYSLEDYFAFARDKAPHVTIGLYDIKRKEDARRFGVVTLDDQQKVQSFEEKPEHPQSSLIAMCLYYMPAESVGLVRRYIEESKKKDKAGDYIRWLSREKGVFGFQFNGKWYDIGSKESYDQAQAYFGGKHSQ